MIEHEKKETAARNKPEEGAGSDKVLDALLNMIFTERGMDFRDYKKASLKRRIQKRLDANNLTTYTEYMKLLVVSPEEYSRLFDTVFINVTEFFRDTEAWQALDEEAISAIIARKKKGDPIRIWSAGCATGEEPYSLAMLLAERLGETLKDYRIRIYATDIDESALVEARRGVFSQEKLKNVKHDLIEKYFTRENNELKISRTIRQLVVFGRQSLVTDAPISHLDLLVCRNVLIYFNVDLQNKLLSRLHNALDRDGYAFFGKSESMLIGSRLFKIVNKKWRIFQKYPE